MPPRARIASLAWSRLKSTSEPVTTMLMPVERARRATRRARPPSSRRPRATCRTISRCQSTANHSTTASAIVGPTPSAVGELVEVGRPRSPAIEPNSVASARAAVGPTCRMDRPTSTRHSGPVLGRGEVVEQPLPVGREHRGVALALLGRAGEQRRPEQLGLVEEEHVALVLDDARPRAARGPPRSRAPRCRRPPGRPRGRRGRAAGRGTCGGWGSAGPCRPPSAARASCRRTGTRSASPRARVPRAAAPAPDPTISGITSPALRRTTVSPGRTSLRLTSWALCRVARSTVDPATRVGSITPKGVTRPVRPVFTSMASSLALTSSGGYLKAIAQRGARLVDPRRRCRLTSSTLITTPSISCSTSWRCSP